MKTAPPPICRAILSLATLLAIAPMARAQLWREFSHSDAPHEVTYDIPITITELLDGTTDVIELPVLVVLLEFSDVTHQPDHTALFYHDFVFGIGSGEWTADHSSVKQIFEANSNGRLLLVPAVETNGTSNDGIVGWVTAQCPPGTSGAICVDGTQDNQSCDPVAPDPCVNGGGHCEACDSWEYYRWKDWKKRAEAIRRADAFVNFASYDTRDRFWRSDSDGRIRSNELAVVVIHARPNCQDHHGHPAWGEDACTGGTMRPTDPADVPVDGVLAHQHPGVMPEANTADVLAHELAHESFGMADLYGIDTDSCNPIVRTAMGSICYPCAQDAQACNDACDAAPCLEDMGAFETSWANHGATVNSTGSDLTTCGVDDSNDVWFTYTPAYSDNVVISLCDNACSFDTTLAVFDGCGGPQLAGACNNDFACAADCTQLSQLTLAMTAGTTYQIRVSGQSAATGTYELGVTGGGGVCDYPRDSKWYPQPAGPFSMMDNQHTYLPHLDAWAKIHLGFVKPLVATEDGTYTLYDAETARSFTQQDAQPEALVIYDPRRPDPFSEYFIVENRNVIGWNGVNTVDSGLAVWLVHENPFPGDGSMELRRGLQLIRRGTWAADHNALWDGADSDYYDLTMTSVPKNTSWTDGTESYIEIRDISPAGPVMTLQIRLPGVFVDAANQGSENGSQQLPYDTVTEGIEAVDAAGGSQTIRIGGGTYSVGSSVISTPCTLAGWRDGPVIIRQ